jgi:hypothetical protein
VFDHEDKIYSTKLCTWVLSTNSFTPLVNKNLQLGSKQNYSPHVNKVKNWKPVDSWCELCTHKKYSLPWICSNQEHKTACLVLYWGYAHFGECEPILVVSETRRKILPCFCKLMRNSVQRVYTLSNIRIQFLYKKGIIFEIKWTLNVDAVKKFSKTKGS